MKNYIHVVGGKDTAWNAEFKYYMGIYEGIARDTPDGHVKHSPSRAGYIQQANSQRIEEMLTKGLGWIGYSVHSSASTFEFNLSDPQLLYQCRQILSIL